MFALLWLHLLSLFLEISPDDEEDDEDEDNPSDDEDEDEEEDPQKTIQKLKDRIQELSDVRKPHGKIAALQDQVNRLHRRLKERDQTIKDLEEGVSTSHLAALKQSRLETAFLQFVIRYDDPLDVESAWDLGNARHFFDTVKIADDGTISGMDEAIDTLLSRYPWLSDGGSDPDPEDDSRPPKPKTGTHPPKSTNNAAASKTAMRDRFPALKHRR